MKAPGGRGRVAARVALALLVIVACAALSGAAAGSAAATGPVPYVSLHLDKSTATFSVPSWSLSSSACQFGEPGTSESLSAALSAGSGGTGVLTLTLGGGGGSMSGSVSSPGSKELQVDLTGKSGNGVGSYNLNVTGYGTTFTGSATLSDPTCTYSSSEATLSLAGTGLTLIDEKVAVSLDPDKVDVCTSSCTSVLAKATVTNADTGQAISGHSVSFSSSDPKVGIGSVTDHGDGTYTATLHPSDEPGDVTITATDTSAFGEPSGDANLEQDCVAQGSAGHAAGYVQAKSKKHCTLTTLTCPDVDFGLGSGCLITVIDTTKHPTKPTGTVTVTTWAPRSSGTLMLSGPCKLKPTHSADRSICQVDIVALPGSVDVLAQYPGDRVHDSSLRATTFVVSTPPAKFLSFKKDLLIAGKSLQIIGGVTVVAGKAQAGTVILGASGVATMELGGVEGGAGTVIYYLGDSLSDPPDAAYRTVDVPHIPKTPNLPPGSSPLAVTARSFLANHVAMAAIAPVLHTTLDRAVSAGKAGNWKARTAQVEAAAKYLDQLAGLFDSDIAVQRKLAALLKGSPLAPLSAAKSRLDAARASLAKSLPGGVGSVFASLHASPAQFEKTLGALSLSGKVNIAAGLVSPGLIKAEKAIAAGLRQLATDPAPDAYPTPAVLPGG